MTSYPVVILRFSDPLNFNLAFVDDVEIGATPSHECKFCVINEDFTRGPEVTRPTYRFKLGNVIPISARRNSMCTYDTVCTLNTNGAVFYCEISSITTDGKIIGELYDRNSRSMSSLIVEKYPKQFRLR